MTDRDTLQVLQHFLPLPDPVKKQMLALMKVLRTAENTPAGPGGALG